MTFKSVEKAEVELPTEEYIDAAGAARPRCAHHQVRQAVPVQLAEDEGAPQGAVRLVRRQDRRRVWAALHTGIDREKLNQYLAILKVLILNFVNKEK
jgi:hypothetical protein